MNIIVHTHLSFLPSFPTSATPICRPHHHSSSVNAPSCTLTPPNPTQSTHFPSDHEAYHNLCTCWHRRDYQTASKIWQDYIRSAAPSTRLLGIYVKILCSTSHLTLAQTVLSQYPRLDGAVPRTSLIGALARCGDVDAALHELHRCRKLYDMHKPYAWTSCLHALSVANRFPDAFKLLESAEQSGVHLDITMYNAVLHGLALQGRTEEAFTLAGKASANGLKADAETYKALIYACAHGKGGAEMAKRALVVYEAAKVDGFEKDVAGGVASALLSKGVGDERGWEVMPFVGGGKRKSLRRLLEG